MKDADAITRATKNDPTSRAGILLAHAFRFWSFVEHHVGGAVIMPVENARVAEQLSAIRQQLALIEDQLAAIREQQQVLQALVAPTPAAAPALSQSVLADCGHDVVQVLHEVARPLTTLELMDELVHRRMRWRENTVLRALTELVDQHRVIEVKDNGAHTYHVAAAA
jgi:hypothetical protein